MISAFRRPCLRSSCLGLLLWNTWQAARHGDQSELSTRAANKATEGARRIRGSGGARSAVSSSRRRTAFSLQISMGATSTSTTPAAACSGILPRGNHREDHPRPAFTGGRHAFQQHRERLLRGDVELGEWEARRKDGSYLPVEVSAKILPDGRWQVFVRDITERKRIERELRYSEAKFSGIVSISADAIILIDEQQNIVLFNEGAQRIFGYSATEAMNRASRDSDS